ncbi:MAG: hypothetical protein M3Q12_03605 [Pseudomonadota bacterium]|uniref:hypothetical protein n=1 Tax=Polaromonas sp. TaxID=1869339 RepID=UPI00178FAD93|nr:hypothetical protein [Polaromonas sp.]MBA3595138.1 hypothetical protein [Polaromonas sp.]MDQ3271243.1 hypothetical protein [Pseudomonadota bacterium]
MLGALLFAQMLGLMHQLVHAPHEAAAVASKGQQRHAPQVDAHAHAHDHDHGQQSDWLETLFAGHDEGSNSCRVFDQQGHSAPMAAVALLVLPSVLRSVPPPAATNCDRVAAAAPFEARAPPLAS